MKARQVVGLLLASAMSVATACSSTTPTPTPIPQADRLPDGSPLSAAVNEYFYYRARSIVARDPEVLWQRYPALRFGEDLATGVNTEGWLATRSDAARSLADLMYDLDRYQPERILSKSGDRVVIRIHGLEKYIERNFSVGTAGEFILDLELREVSGSWTIVRSDAMTLAEFHASR